MNSGQWPNRPTRRSVLTRLGGLGLALLSRTAWAQTGKAEPTTPWDSSFEMAVNLEVNTIDDTRVHRPYIAVWIEDKNGNSLRTLALWIENNQKGWRYVRNLRRWWRDDQYRVEHGSTEIATTVSSATRMPGKYSLVWNGKDNDDKPVPMGDYYLCIEAAREHGTYQLMWKAISIHAKPFSATIAGNVELKEATVEYRKRK